MATMGRVTAPIDVRLFVDGEALTSKRMNEIVDRLNALGAKAEDAGAGPALAIGAAIAASSARRFGRRRLLWPFARG